MPDNTIFSLEGPVRGVTVTCDSGKVWITQAGDSHDYVVSAGMSFTAHGDGSVVIQLMKDARVTVWRPDMHPGRRCHLLPKCRLAHAADSPFRRAHWFLTPGRCNGSSRRGPNCLQGGGT